MFPSPFPRRPDESPMSRLPEDLPCLIGLPANHKDGLVNISESSDGHIPLSTLSGPLDLHSLPFHSRRLPCRAHLLQQTLTEASTMWSTVPIHSTWHRRNILILVLHLPLPSRQRRTETPSSSDSYAVASSYSPPQPPASASTLPTLRTASLGTWGALHHFSSSTNATGTSNFISTPSSSQRRSLVSELD
jgi:hypothetical protein